MVISAGPSDSKRPTSTAKVDLALQSLASIEASIELTARNNGPSTLHINKQMLRQMLEPVRAGLEEAAALIAEVRAHREPEASGTAECPICKMCTPHAHHRSDLQSWVDNQLARWGFESIVFDSATRKHTFRAQLKAAWDKGYAAGSEDACYSCSHPGSDRRTENPHTGKFGESLPAPPAVKEPR